MADALDDDFVVGSDVESLVAGEVEGDVFSDQEVNRQEVRGTKRKAAGEAVAVGNGDAPANYKDDKESKKRKRKAQQEKRKKKRAAVEAVKAAQKPYPLLPPDVQAEHMKAFQKEAFPKLTALELNEMQIGESSYATVTDLHPKRGLDDLCALCRNSVPAAQKSIEDPESACRTRKGSPAVLMITGNAMRAADLARPLRGLLPGGSQEITKETDEKGRKKSKEVKGAKGKSDVQTTNTSGPTVAKLFARHFKVAEQLSYLASHITPVAVGTPARISHLLDPPEGEKEGQSKLQVDALQAVIIDASWKDQKERTVVDGLETRADLFKLLDQLKERFRSGQCKLVLF